MVKFCPKCGTEAKKGSNFCLGCGAQLQADAAAQPVQTPPPAVQPVQPQQPIPPPVAPQQGYAPMPPQKSNMKLIGVIIAVVAIVVVLVVVLLLFGGGSAGDFVGTWSLDSYVEDGESSTPSDSTITFLSDGTYTASSVTGSGTWGIRNNKVYIISPTGGGPLDDVDLDFSFDNNNNRLTISYSGTIDGESLSMTMVLTRN